MGNSSNAVTGSDGVPQVSSAARAYASCASSSPPASGCDGCGGEAGSRIASAAKVSASGAPRSRPVIGRASFSGGGDCGPRVVLPPVVAVHELPPLPRLLLLAHLDLVQPFVATVVTTTRAISS